MTARMILREAALGQWLSFSGPDHVFEAQLAEEVPDVLRQAEQRVRAERCYAVGFVSYEAAAGFDTALTTRHPDGSPLARFAIFDTAAPFDPPPVQAPPATSWQFLETRSSYREKIARIHESLGDGKTYQVNYTTRLSSSEIRDPWPWFLWTGMHAPYAAYLEFDDFTIASASPELFFRIDGNAITTRPMKGTTRRGMTVAEDAALRQALAASEKDRAENIMITDMLRNDLGRIATPGSVEVTSLLDVEKYPTVWQMTSTVEAESDASVNEIFAALFPCASVTGAPKVSSMQLIAELENTPRGVYTGAIGYMGPDRRSQFSVGIRTATFDKQAGVGQYGVGGGIVWDSDADDEYEECLTKSLVVTSMPYRRDFRLLETLLWRSADGYFLLDRHLDRIGNSADYFDYSFDKPAALAVLNDLKHSFGAQDQRVRLLLDRAGSLKLSYEPVDQRVSDQVTTLCIAESPIHKLNPFLYHKSTERSVYENALAKAPECDDVLLWNEDGELTESTIANLIVTLDGRRYTPPVSSGLLAGTFRQHLLDAGDIEERVIRFDDLDSADAISLVNSVRGEYAARLTEDLVAPRRTG